MKSRILTLSIAAALAAACTTESNNRQDTDLAQTGDPSAGTVTMPVTNPAPLETRNESSDLDPREPARSVNRPTPSLQPATVAETDSSTPPGIAQPEEQVFSKSPAPAASIELIMSDAAGQRAQHSLRHPSEPLYREQYEHPEDNRVTRVIDNPVSTFSIDVDTGAYANARRWLSQGSLPPEDAVRVEEFVNYFDYDYALPAPGSAPFHVETEIAPTPWNQQTHLFRIGIQGYEVPRAQIPASNLVFLIDVSGSMRSNDKLPLLKQALGMLTRQLTARDCISIVVYAGSSGVVLEPTPGDQKVRILNALERLEAGGSTNGGAGLKLAYQMARQKFKTGGVNRVILATDGDFNVGQASTTELIDMIQRKRKEGIALTTLGFGTGNYNDHMLEQLADEGNGNHAYIDRLSEARKVLSDELSSTLLTIASDVKIQVEFNPETVAEYRLIGYENRALDEEDFDNDKIDAGEIGAGHSVTALYELSFTGSDYRRLPERRYGANRPHHPEIPGAGDAELAHLKIRYKNPGSANSRLISTPVLASQVLQSGSRASENFRFASAVAAFGQKLRGGVYLESFGWTDIADLARNARGSDHFGYRSEFVQLVGLAEVLDPDQAVARSDDRD